VSGGTATVDAPRAAAKPKKPKKPKGFDRPRFLRVFVAFAYLFLFAPIFVVILFSFNSIKSLQNFEGFSLQWYEEFLNDPTLRDSLFASLEIAVLSMIAGTILGTMLAIGLVRSRAKWSGGANILMLIPLVVPEIVAGISALLIFSQIGIQLSIFTVVLAHITFSISYVAIVVRARLATIGTEAEEAAMDLGATRLQSVRMVLLPALWPAIVAAGLLVFALSFDDFVLSFFTTGEDVQPLPVRIWSAIRFGLSPTINAIGTLMMVVSITAIGLAVLIPRLFGRKESGIKVLTGQEGG
jgi:spermidine/putrescine transport system permease protein